MNPNSAVAWQSGVTDVSKRPLLDLRISITDRCNFRCQYCMPKEVFGTDFSYLKKEDLLTDDEIVRLARIFAGFGVGKVRLTGGEPLLRPGVEELVKRLATIPGIQDLSLSTNGSLLSQASARKLREAGLQRLNISLDALDDHTFIGLNDMGVSVQQVLNAVAAANTAGLAPVKINMVVIKGRNDDQVVDMARHFRGTGHIVRFIEYMDVGNTNGWRMEQVLSADEIVARINRYWPLRPLAPTRAGEVATRYAYEDGQGEIGVISSVTKPFCQGCTRARLTANGRLMLCLFGAEGYDLRTPLREGESDAEIAARIRAIWAGRDDRYSELRTNRTERPAKMEMSQIGG